MGKRVGIIRERESAKKGSGILQKSQLKSGESQGQFGGKKIGKWIGRAKPKGDCRANPEGWHFRVSFFKAK
jgi:hypothetical protein